MSYVVCLEESEGGWIAHVPALLGCFAEEDIQEAALTAAPAAITAYAERLHRAVITVPPLTEPVTVQVEEISREWADPANPDHIVNAFFACDALPLTQDETNLALRLLDLNRQEQRAAIADLVPQQLDQVNEQGWSIRRILHHIGGAEWWYLTRLDLEPVVPRPEGWEGCQDVARRRLVDILPQLVGVARIGFKDSELWSPRKILRRALWHEQDHTQHILRFKRQLGLA